MRWKAVGCAVACGLIAFSSSGQQGDLEILRQQLKDANDKLEKALQEHRAIIQQLNTRINALESQPPAAAPTNATTTAVALTEPVTPNPVLTPSWSPEKPIRIGAGQNYLNLSFDGLFAAGSSTAKDIERLQPGGHDPKQRGFTVQNLEPTFEGKVDPYFRAQATISMQITPQGETTIEAEEAYAETMGLPANLQLKGGLFFTEFGRINSTHAHTWDFVDSPLVATRIMGPDGLRNPGVRLSWLVPTSFYSELFFTVQNASGQTAFSFDTDFAGEPVLGRTNSQHGIRNLGDLLYVPRYAASFDLGPSQTILAGISGAFGPNASGTHAHTEIYGVDLFYKWKPINHHAGFPFVSWQTEAMLRRYKAAEAAAIDLNGDNVVDFVPRETLQDYGFYTQIAYGFHKGWVAAVRADLTASDIAEYEKTFGRDPDRATRWRLSPNLTWYPAEFSKLRLQYNFDDRTGIGIDHSVWMQFEFLLGTHAAHKF
jgi:hypothetical protein